MYTYIVLDIMMKLKEIDYLTIVGINEKKRMLLSYL